MPILYRYWLLPIIYKLKKDSFDLEFTYIYATDNLYEYANITFSYDDVMHYHYNKALEEFLNACEVAYKSIYAESK